MSYGLLRREYTVECDHGCCGLYLVAQNLAAAAKDIRAKGWSLVDRKWRCPQCVARMKARRSGDTKRPDQGGR